MFNSQNTTAVPDRQPAVNFTRNRHARFATDSVELWGIDESYVDADPGKVGSRLTMILSFKNHSSRKAKDTLKRLSKAEIKGIARDALERLIDGNGEWSQGIRPTILMAEDPEIEGIVVDRISYSQWSLIVYVSAPDTYEGPDTHRY